MVNLLFLLIQEAIDKLSEYNYYNQAASTRTLMVPWLFAVSIVGLSLFQQTALIKYEPASSSASSMSGDPNLCDVTGLVISCIISFTFPNTWANERDCLKCVKLELLKVRAEVFQISEPCDIHILRLSRFRMRDTRYSPWDPQSSSRWCVLWMFEPD